MNLIIAADGTIVNFDNVASIGIDKSNYPNNRHTYTVVAHTNAFGVGQCVNLSSEYSSELQAKNFLDKMKKSLFGTANVIDME